PEITGPGWSDLPPQKSKSRSCENSLVSRRELAASVTRRVATCSQSRGLAEAVRQILRLRSAHPQGQDGVRPPSAQLPSKCNRKAALIGQRKDESSVTQPVRRWSVKGYPSLAQRFDRTGASMSGTVTGCVASARSAVYRWV